MANYRTFNEGFITGYSNLPISSYFGKRYHPIKKKITNHNGIDIAIPSGTELKAPLSGLVTRKRVENNGAGLLLEIEHVLGDSKKIRIIFAHLSSVKSDINIGSRLNEGDVFGKSGGSVNDKPNCGSSTGAHLHLEIRFGSSAVNPINWLSKFSLFEKSSGKSIQKGDSEKMFFDSDFITTQSYYKYSSDKDITISDATEFETIKKEVTTVSKERLALGIWQITKLLVDSSVEGKQVTESGISTQQGSLLNFFRKVCQEPLVEFMGDTFGNQYYWIVRKPPFDKEGITNMIDLTILNLSDNDIISTDLTWNNQGIYSWYQYIPYMEMMGVKEVKLFTPAIFFPEYAAVWGSRPLSVESNYFNFTFSGKFNDNKEENKSNGDRIARNAISDLKFMIESNAYMPFTRRGTITIVGDRRIKRGTLIRHTSGEVFYVDSVTNTFDVSIQGTNRVTTLQVSRGMYPSFIYGKYVDEFEDKNFSYFNIIDFGKDFNLDNIDQDNWESEISKWKVDTDVFNFFMSRRQVYFEKMYKRMNIDESGSVELDEIVITANKK